MAATALPDRHDSFAPHSLPGVSSAPRANHGFARLAKLVSFDVLVASVMLLVLLAMLSRSMADPDIWWHLGNARQMLDRHAFVRSDVSSFTAYGSPWIDHEWLSELLFFAGWRVAGAQGVYQIALGALVCIFVGVLVLAARASRNVLTAAAVTLWAALLSTVSFGPRTLLFGWCCLVAQMLLVDGSRRHPRLLLLLPLLYVCWVNLHGSWLIGLAVLLLSSLDGMVPVRMGWIRSRRFGREQQRCLLLAWVAIVPALFCNPWGWRLVLYPFNFAFRQTLNVAHVEEWHSLDFGSSRARLLLAAVVFVAGRQMVRPRRWTAAELALGGLGLYAALCHTRFLFLVALLAAPVVARSFRRHGSARRSDTQGQSIRLNAVLLLCVLTMAAAYLARQRSAPDPAMGRYPSTAALDALARLDPHTRVFQEFRWGGYLEWRQPARHVFIDSRVDLFEYNGTFRDYLSIIRIVDTEALLERYRIDAVLFEPDTPLVYLLQRTQRWSTRFQDGNTVLLVRTQPLTHSGTSPIADRGALSANAREVSPERRP